MKGMQGIKTKPNPIGINLQSFRFIHLLSIPTPPLEREGVYLLPRFLVHLVPKLQLGDARLKLQRCEM
jgi:hypothetical protein